jgi:hypothetical protein
MFVVCQGVSEFELLSRGSSELCLRGYYGSAVLNAASNQSVLLIARKRTTLRECVSEPCQQDGFRMVR